MTQAEERARVVEIARSWLRTPYHHTARKKGHGVDCLTILAEVFEEAGLVPHVKLPHYSMQWMHHRSEELYLDGLLQYTHEVETPQPGDIVLWKIGRCFSHGAIVTDWPLVVHAMYGRNVVEEDAEKIANLTHIGERLEGSGRARPKKFFSFWS